MPTKPHAMRVPFRLLFFGWWMAVQRWMVAGQFYRKPSASVSPQVVALGENVTVRCSNAERPYATFHLYKRDSVKPHLPLQTAESYEVEFIISNTKISDAGIYWCIYRVSSGSRYWDSHYSDPVHINVTDPSIPQPSIKVKSVHQNILHSNITIECQGPEDGLNFFLRKANTWEISQEAAATGTTASFYFLQVKEEDAGRYICQYHHRSTPFVWSKPSDPVELIPKVPKPSIKMRPKGQHGVGTKVTIRCKGPEYGLTYSLHRFKNRTVLQTKEAQNDTAQFFLSPLRPEDAGNYTCQYYHRGNPLVHSEPSDPVEVIVTENPMTIIWASVAAGLLLVLFLLVLIMVLCKKRRKRSTVKEGDQPVNRVLKQNAGTGQDDREDYDGVTYAVLKHQSLKIKQPAPQHTGPESCVYASVSKERTGKV